jgi:hypothetical protein
MEIEHLRIACELMRRVEKRDPEALLPAALDRRLTFKENKAWVRDVLARQVNLTSKGSAFVPVEQLAAEDRYFVHQRAVNDAWAPTEAVIAETVARRGEEYRLETDGPNPVPGLRTEKDRKGAATEYARRAAEAA